MTPPFKIGDCDECLDFGILTTNTTTYGLDVVVVEWFAPSDDTIPPPGIDTPRTMYRRQYEASPYQYLLSTGW
jgi:hypothetical protein